ncbi:hypothetical protein TorRG33x02_006000 [Trema orientale]|uniref:Uncharacterized protein n=1 Tax=Trema orientale TaxID=63057 RepID=A0A2P5G030_TREOI|nr:hypothetical protein TorRG33x02_006000 [Trema orientale]
MGTSRVEGSMQMTEEEQEGLGQRWRPDVPVGMVCFDSGKWTPDGGGEAVAITTNAEKAIMAGRTIGRGGHNY